MLIAIETWNVSPTKPCGTERMCLHPDPPPTVHSPTTQRARTTQRSGYTTGWTFLAHTGSEPHHSPPRLPAPSHLRALTAPTCCLYVPKSTCFHCFLPSTSPFSFRHLQEQRDSTKSGLVRKLLLSNEPSRSPVT
jgi:hypothetical protein